jgi:cysteine rich repeat protein
MKVTTHLPVRFAALPLLVILSAGSASAQSNIGKTIVDKLAVKVAVLEKSCAGDIKKYCRDVTPGEGRMIYCMQAHEDKISPTCAYELGQTAVSVQATADLLKDGVLACKAEIAGVCGKIQPGQGRVAACLIANKSAASKDCAEAIQKVEAMAAQ